MKRHNEEEGRDNEDRHHALWKLPRVGPDRHHHHLLNVTVSDQDVLTHPFLRASLTPKGIMAS